ncbi:amino acid racemase [Paenibacillus rhizovicinus]|uniref:Amino acid racemase n=1 Tax=Paenibacillus rhizovicinus TaxID=2704463 RepID=A0A6C0P0U1_9BACL|nr:amino acid racemase [Paenibacillus rhizovicinus]QHW32104.1 amino acid racemase [Paenibacillus rhizovicinus]
MERKRLGVLGGMGPKATTVFIDQIIENTPADRDQDHIDMVILNHASLPDRTHVILENSGELFLQEIEKDIRLLEYAEVANIVMPCNTGHYYINEMQAMTTIPIIDMVEETMREIADNFGGGVKVGILATNGTLRSGIYSESARRYGMIPQEPDMDVQQQVMSIIYGDIKRGIASDPAKLEGIIQGMVEKDGCSCVIIACTELSIIKLSEETKKVSIDAMDVLVQKSIELSLVR